jgi:hypothetical protein
VLQETRQGKTAPPSLRMPDLLCSPVSQTLQRAMMLRGGVWQKRHRFPRNGYV